ncbi:MAG: SprB repeat-containing protein [Saprospiraceae bacterium]|nr:SprB repeat-containing protein [Saprospiraceae bacterium]
MRKLNFLFFLVLFVLHSLNSQAVKVWSKLYGGNGTEQCFGSTSLNDSLFAVVGNTNSANLVNKGLTDGIIGVFNKTGDLKVFKTFGGPQQDQFNSVDQLPNGHLICAGQNNGAGGDVPNNLGLIDGFLCSYNPLTNTKNWSKTFGGGNNDQISDVKFLENGKIIFVGSSKSIAQDLPMNNGLFDAFVGTIDEAGNIVRVKVFGGTKDDFAKKIAKINEGSFYVGGETVSSNEGSFLGLSNKGKKDVFVLKLNRNSNQLSIFMLGGPGDDLLVDMATTPDDGIVLVLNVNSEGGDIDSLKGLKDIYVVRYDNNGKLLWKKAIGGTKDDEAVAAKLNSAGELLITSTSNSSDGDIVRNYGDKDVMLFKLDNDGNLISSSNYGGSRGDVAGSIVVDQTNTYLISSSFSLNNDLPNNNPGGDFWLLNLFECSKAATQYNREICLGDTIDINGTSYHSGNTSGQFTIKGGGRFGCDSIVDVVVSILQPTSEFLGDTLCNEATVTINNVLFDKNKTAHSFLLKNHLGCDSVLNVLLYFSPEIVLKDSSTKSDNGGFNGYVHITVEGGVPPYAFEWSNGNRTIDLDNVRFGTYTVTITDALKCTKSYSFEVRNTVNSEDLGHSQLDVLYSSESVVLKCDDIIRDFKIYTLNQSLPLLVGQALGREVVINRDQLISGFYCVLIETLTGRKIIKKFLLR